jgi:cystathionine gamma-lyase
MSPALNITSPIANGVVHPHTNGLKKPMDGFGTRAVHVGSDANEETGAVIPPISLSTTYKQSAIGVHKVS